MPDTTDTLRADGRTSCAILRLWKIPQSHTGAVELGIFVAGVRARGLGFLHQPSTRLSPPKRGADWPATGRALVLRIFLQEALEQDQVFFLGLEQLDGQVLCDVIFAFGGADDLLVVRHAACSAAMTALMTPTTSVVLEVGCV